MADLLVPLYKLPARSEGENALLDQNIQIRRPNTFELTPVLEFIKSNFSQGWADETAATFGRQPISSFIAIENGKTVGFAAFDSTRRAFFGPTGVAVSHRGKGIGKALLIASLWGLSDLGYAYSIIGSAGPVEFYKKTVGAIVIPDSSPGVYANLLERG
ncbi:MAG: GNAT family N-acetyltransferase [Capsulimonas sp.]|uniref:GNAT family N-acetyltransferase n=1 Tax=Capsulimonas sp. TaxID=2494211 RepID=UPI003263220D